MIADRPHIVLQGHSFTSQDLTPYDFDTSKFMTFTKRLRHMFKPFEGIKGTVLESRLLPGNSAGFPGISVVFPGISAFFPGISAFFPDIFVPGVFNFGLILVLLCSFCTRNLQKQRHIYDMI